MKHFDSKSSGTKILDLEPKEFENKVNLGINLFNSKNKGELPDIKSLGFPQVVKVIDGYAPFCKLVPIRNFTDARVGALPVNFENLALHQYVRHGYSSRREEELDFFTRWLELPVPAPKANYLMLVLYSKEQIDKEALAMYNRKVSEGGLEAIGLEEPEPFEGDWGIVAILGQFGSDEEPMKPSTMERNYMPIEFGGSGMKYPTMPAKPDHFDFVDFDEPELAYERALALYNEEVSKYKDEMEEIRQEHQRCVDFWKEHVTVR
jgi:hypothetical protein